MDRVGLVKTLELLKPALDSKNLVPIFSCFMFKHGSVTANNDVIAITAPSELEAECAIHGLTLLGILSSSSSDDVSIELNGQNAIVTLGKSISKLPFEGSDAFIFDEPTEKFQVKIAYTEGLNQAILECLETVSVDETQKKLHGVTIDGSRLFSCNGDTITRVVIKDKSPTRCLMPTAFCEAVTKLWSSLSMVKGTLQFNEEWVFANFEDWAVYGRLLAIDDPIDFDDLIKRTVKSKIAAQPAPDGLVEALSRARVLADPESQQTELTISKGKLNLLTRTHMGEVRDTLSFKGHPDITANVNAAYLHKALQRCDKIAVYDNCVVLEKDSDVLLVVSNLG